MNFHPTRWATLCVAIAFAAPAAQGQQRPSPQEAEALLKANPELAAQVRAKLQGSGLTPDQVRARLRAEGYPEHLLDQYLQPGTSADSVAAPSPKVAAALRALAVDVDSGDTAALGRERVVDRTPRATIERATLAASLAVVAASRPDARRAARIDVALDCVPPDAKPVSPPYSGRATLAVGRL